MDIKADEGGIGTDWREDVRVDGGGDRIGRGGV